MTLQGLIQGVAYLVIALAFGAHLEAGRRPARSCSSPSPPLVGIAFGSLGLAIGIRTGNGEAVQGVFPLLFVLLFLSSGALPRDLIANDWFETSRPINPVSYLIEGFRSLFVVGWDGEALALGVRSRARHPRRRDHARRPPPCERGWSAREPPEDEICARRRRDRLAPAPHHGRASPR